MEDIYEEDYNEYTIPIEEYRKMECKYQNEIHELEEKKERLEAHIENIINFIQDNELANAYEYCVKEGLVNAKKNKRN